MNKKGFTLVEIMAVIVILAIVMLIGSVGINAARKKIAENMFKSKLELIINRAQDWGQDNKELLTENFDIDGETVSGKAITISDLIASKYVTPDTDGCVCKASEDPSCSSGQTLSADKMQCQKTTSRSRCASGYQFYNDLCYMPSNLNDNCISLYGQNSFAYNGNCYYDGQEPSMECPSAYPRKLFSNVISGTITCASAQFALKTQLISMCASDYTYLFSNRKCYRNGTIYCGRDISVNNTCLSRDTATSPNNCEADEITSGGNCQKTTSTSAICPNNFILKNGECIKEDTCLENDVGAICSTSVLDNNQQAINSTQIKVYISNQRVYACISSIVSASDSSLYQDYICN